MLEIFKKVMEKLNNSTQFLCQKLVKFHILCLYTKILKLEIHIHETFPISLKNN